MFEDERIGWLSLRIMPIIMQTLAQPTGFSFGAECGNTFIKVVVYKLSKDMYK